MQITDRPLRADAERNRRLLLDAARALFAERGLGVSLDDIAERAGVGVGTAYRRFGSREALIDVLFEERVEEVLGLAREALAREDPWAALKSFLESSIALQAADRGLKEVLLGADGRHARVTRIRDGMRPLVGQIFVRAQGAGVLRADFAPQDMPFLQMMLGSVVDASESVAPGLWRRYLALLLDGMRAGGPAPGPLDPPPVDWGQLTDVLACWRPPRR